MLRMKRREFLQTSSLMGAGIIAADRAWSLNRLEPIEGVSLVPALDGSDVVKTAAFSQYPRRPKDLDVPWQSNGIDHADPSKFEYMGYSVRGESMG